MLQLWQQRCEGLVGTRQPVDVTLSTWLWAALHSARTGPYLSGVRAPRNYQRFSPLQ